MFIIVLLIFFYTALHRAGKHMENSIIASYVALLLGCLIQDNTVSSQWLHCSVYLKFLHHLKFYFGSQRRSTFYFDEPNLYNIYKVLFYGNSYSYIVTYESQAEPCKIHRSE